MARIRGGRRGRRSGGYKGTFSGANKKVRYNQKSTNHSWVKNERMTPFARWSVAADISPDDYQAAFRLVDARITTGAYLAAFNQSVAWMRHLNTKYQNKVGERFNNTLAAFRGQADYGSNTTVRTLESIQWTEALRDSRMLSDFSNSASMLKAEAAQWDVNARILATAYLSACVNALGAPVADPVFKFMAKKFGAKPIMLNFPGVTFKGKRRRR